MKIGAFLIPSVILLSCVAKSQCVADSAANVYSFTYGGTTYEIVKENKNWVDAAACAVERGGRLVEINDQQENDTLFYELMNNAAITTSNTVAPDGGNASYLWIGGSDLQAEGNWIWDGGNSGSGTQFWQGTNSGSSVGGLYNNWGDEPDDFQGQDALGFAISDWPLGVAGQWNDVDETNALYYIIEYSSSSNNIEEETSMRFKIYPNPSTEKVVIQIPEMNLKNGEQTFYIYDEKGEVVEEVKTNSAKTTLDISTYANGTYIIHLNNIIVGQFVVE